MIKGTQVRKAVVAAIAAVTAFAVLAPFAPGASAASNYTQTRYAGSDRFDTAALIASAIAEATPTAVLARADIFPDALTGAFAAAANGDGPLLLTRSDAVPARTMQALQDEGVNTVIILGGTAAISSNVDRQLQDAGYQTQRLEGATRYHTAAAIARNGAPIIGTIDGNRAALLSSGQNFPDALAGAPLSFAAGLPSLLTPTNSLHPVTVEALNDLNIAHVYLLGGPVAVSQSVEDDLRNRGFGVTRLAGGNRSATSVEVFEFGMDKGIYTNRRFGLARGDAFPDALAYAPLGGRPRTSPAPQSGVADTGGQANGLLLAASHCTLSNEVENFILAHDQTWTEGEILGGPAAICEEVAQQVAAAASTEAAPQAEVALSPTSGQSGSQVTVTYTGDRPANITDVSSTNCTITNEGSQTNNRTVTVSGAEGTQCTITTTVTFTDAEGGTRTFTDTFTVSAPAADVALNPTSGPSGTQVTATYTGDRPANITDVSSTNCTIGSEGTQTQARTFTVSGASGTACTITTTVTYTDTEGGTDTFTDTFTITAPAGNATASVRPELRTASIGATSSAGTLVTYCFDEEVSGPTTPVVGNFHVYTADGDTQHDATGTPVITSDTTGTNNCVQVNFAGITTANNLATSLTLATVDFGAVTDNETSQNPIGDAPIGSGQQATLVAGETAAPDLLTVTDCAPEPTGAGADTDATAETRCTFTFDETAFTVTPAGFHLVLTTGEQINCVALSGAEGGMTATGDTTIVAECEQTATSGPIANAAVARGFVDVGAVSDASADQAARADNNESASDFTAAEGEGCDVANDDIIADDCVGNLNPLQATDNPDVSTPAPDLESATLGAETTANDTIIYDFDETVQTTLTNASFCFYTASGDQTCGTGTAARGTGDDSTVVVTFAEGTLNQAVGASVLGGAASDVNGVPNEEDEEGMANSTQSATQAGRTDNPDLTGVALQAATTAPTFAAVYTFDEDIDQSALTLSEATPALAGDFFLVAADGTRYVATSCETRTTGEGTPAGTEDTDNQVRCTAYAVANTNGTATTVVPTDNALMQAVIGTVDDGAVTEEVGGGTNPEGAELTVGGTGAPMA